MPLSRNNSAARITAVHKALLLAVGISLIWGELQAAPPVKRARRPQFDKSVRDAFFPDALQKLSGPRPQSVPIAEQPASLPGGTPATATASTSGAPTTGDAKWSAWIDAEVLEDEIKAQQIKLAAAVQSPTKFKGGEYQQARVSLSALAVLFGIVGQYDGQVRWQRDAASLRDRLGRAGFNCKVGTDSTYKEAKARSEELTGLLRGDSLEPAKSDSAASETSLAWPKVADRSPLMKRLEQAEQQELSPGVANEADFNRAASRLLHEAEIVAALAEVITREGYEFADDDDYLAQARAMQTQARALRDAVQEKNYPQARQAAGELTKACAKCHEGYRS
jgi:hypothetical protein